MSTTGSTTLSSSERDRIERTLKAFLEGDYPLAQLVVALGNYMSVDYSKAPDLRVVRNVNLKGVAKIPVGREHIRNMLKRYVDGRISDIELSNWAAFITGPLIFTPEGDTEEQRAEEAEGPVWDILQRLVSPVIFDGLNRDVAERYLDMLG